MSIVYAIRREVVANGPATSRDIALALGITVKKASLYMRRAGAYGMLKKAGTRNNGFCRPSIIWEAK